ncbi:hypothetical protein PR048_000607 [Dryococelus australis]|uniref:Uncharacterized protein n=1 Tax=Dryococelus australis TaxID=614101 RepID=A0ABQ9IFQ0_9NEOP|nr:hypothetical protein PR048_000607 [Dryococelus australis]
MFSKYLGNVSFSNSWLCRDIYKDRLCASKYKYAAKCCFCIKEFSISSLGESALKSHMNNVTKLQKLPSVTSVLLSSDTNQNNSNTQIFPENLTLFPSTGDNLHQAWPLTF